ncbi:MAG: glutamate--tRNA ligase [Actinobacteria bacterium]|nr:glutamate--tRNA ligase [Actinomycetota bacterium]
MSLLLLKDWDHFVIGSPIVAKEVRTRFAPSPTGDLHVGNIRTALFDWAYAKHTGGKLIFRIEDTDRERVTDEYINRAVETMKWLGLDWDEGPEVGGDYGPYLQSQRLEIYTEWAKRFIAQGDAYRCYCTTEELEARREKQRELNQAPGYDGQCRSLSPEQISQYEGEGRKPTIRMRMPDGETRFTDLIRGEVVFEHKYVPDFVLMRGDGSPLYTLAVAIDDVLMKVTHILRGEDLLSSTPRQIRVYQAMGVKEADYPAFAHLPFVMGQDNAKLSKRNGEVSIAWYREEGFLPEAICNYLALLGWSPGDDRENITMSELVQLFTVERVNSSPARFDMKKLEAINGDKIRALDLDDFLARSLPFLMKEDVVSGSEIEIALVRRALPLIQERIARMKEVVPMLRFLFVDEVEIEADSLTKITEESAQHVLQRTLGALEPLTQWSHESIEAALRAVLIDEMGLKPRVAFGPVRIAVTGSHISPPLFESMELLGKESSLSRIRAATK